MKKILALVIAAVMLMSVVSCSSQNDIGWPKDDEFLQLIPVLKGNVSSYYSGNYGSDVRVNVKDKSVYADYIDKLKESGFTVDTVEDKISFSGFNSDGYKVRTIYYERDNEVTIYVDDKGEYKEIKWPKGYLASLVPEPESLVGEIVADNSDYLIINISDTSEEDFEAYSDKCYDSGFDKEYGREERYFSGYNDQGDWLILKYEGFNVMSISIEKHEDETTKATEKQTEAPEPETTATPVTEPPVTEPPVTEPPVTEPPVTQAPVTQAPETQAPNSVDWREFLREYEALIDEYVAFYKEYMANPTDLTLLGKYTEWLGKLNEWSEKSIEIQGLVSLAEVNEYVAEVNRITAKLSNLY